MPLDKPPDENAGGKVLCSLPHLLWWHYAVGSLIIEGPYRHYAERMAHSVAWLACSVYLT